jgi:hypothetical protein
VAFYLLDAIPMLSFVLLFLLVWPPNALDDKDQGDSLDKLGQPMKTFERM